MLASDMVEQPHHAQLEILHRTHLHPTLHTLCLKSVIPPEAVEV
jgi:hypothetical protein